MRTPRRRAIVIASLTVSALFETSAVGVASSNIPSGANIEAVRDTYCRREDFKIAIDVGHTPESSGALSARGRPEYEFNHLLARKIDGTLRGAGFTNTLLVLVRGAGRAQLTARAVRAEAFSADLLLSIHHDDVQPLYYGEWLSNGKKRHYSDRFSGYSIFVSYRNRSADRSLIFARFLGEELRKRGMKFSNHHAENIRGEGRQILDNETGVYLYNELMVLRSAKTPAVLFEAGIIVNRMEELELSSPDRQALISTAVLEATVRFCELSP